MSRALAIVIVVAGVGIVWLLAICKAGARGDRMMGIGETPERGKRDDSRSDERSRGERRADPHGR